MTLIAEFSIDKQPVLIGDVVLSGPEWGDQTSGIPTIGDYRSIFPKGSRTVISGVRQKVNVLSENLMIAWAGQAFVAKTVLTDLRNQIARDGLNFSGLQKFLEQFRQSKERNDIQLIGCVSDGPAVLSFNCGGERVQTKFCAETYLAGTGAEDAAAFFNLLEAPQLLEGSLTPTRYAISRALMTAGHLLQLELTSRSTLLKYYGGGYEIATLVKGKFEKVGDLSYLFWMVDATVDSIRISNPYQVMRQEYRNDLLVLRTARIESDLSFTDEVHVIGPVYRHIEDDELENLQIPDMNSHILVNLLYIRWPDGTTEWMSRVDYRSSFNKHITFRETGNGFEIGVNKAFVESLGRSVKERLKQR